MKKSGRDFVSRGGGAIESVLGKAIRLDSILETELYSEEEKAINLEPARPVRYALFPGQCVAIDAVSASGGGLVARRVRRGAVPPEPRTSLARLEEHSLKQKGEPLAVWVASGPYTTSDNLRYEPLKDLLAEVVLHDVQLYSSDLKFLLVFSRLVETVSGGDLLRVFWKATGHVLESFELSIRHESDLEKRTVVMRRKRNAIDTVTLGVGAAQARPPRPLRSLRTTRRRKRFSRFASRFCQETREFQRCLERERFSTVSPMRNRKRKKNVL